MAIESVDRKIKTKNIKYFYRVHCENGWTFKFFSDLILCIFE
jgi:hypothetical protein